MNHGLLHFLPHRFFLVTPDGDELDYTSIGGQEFAKHGHERSRFCRCRPELCRDSFSRRGAWRGAYYRHREPMGAATTQATR